MGKGIEPMSTSKVVYALVSLWVIVFCGSIVMALNIDGPRNIDTGLARLDVLFRGQILALALSVVAAASPFLVGDRGRAQILIGIAPLTVTILLVAGLFLFVSMRPDDTAAAPGPGREVTRAVDPPATVDSY